MTRSRRAGGGSYHQAICASDDHPHVHGANLEVRASAYRAVGGFPDVAAHEDVVALARAVTRQGTCAVVRTAAVPVLTSPRMQARTPEGLAQDLRGIADGLEVLEPAS